MACKILDVVSLSIGLELCVSVYTMLERQCCLIVGLRGCGRTVCDRE